MKCPNSDGIDLRLVLTRREPGRVAGPRRTVALFEGSKFPGREDGPGSRETRADIETLPEDRLGVGSHHLPGRPQLNHCPASSGLWFDTGELQSILEAERTLNHDIESATSGPATIDSSEANRHAQIRAGMLALPTLFLRSAATLIGLYMILRLVLLTIAEFGGRAVPVIVTVGVFAVVIQFTLGPYLMDLSLR